VSATAVTSTPGLRGLMRSPGLPRLLGAAAVGRLPAASLGLIFVLRTRELTGSLGLAGAVGGLFALATGATMPLLGRLVDRRGQRAVLVACTVVAAVGIAALGLLPEGTGAAPLLACALVTGAGMPPIGSCVRALLPVVLRDPARSHAAFSLDSALVELGFVAGPALIAGALGAWSTTAACVACVLLLAAGIGAFVAHPAAATTNAVRDDVDSDARHAGRLGALRGGGVRLLIAVLGLVGIGFGSIEVGVPAVMARAGSPHAAGVLLAAWGLGSMIGGFAAVHRSAPLDPARRARRLLVVLALADAPLAAAAHPLTLVLLLPIAGLAIAPMFASVFGQLERVAPPGTTTEAYGWLTSGITGGFAVGAALAGQLAERAGPSAALAVAPVASAVAALVAWWRRRALA
jgi:predicted MFS family arabinose efflux permease